MSSEYKDDQDYDYTSDDFYGEPSIYDDDDDFYDDPYVAPVLEDCTCSHDVADHTTGGSCVQTGCRCVGYVL